MIESFLAESRMYSFIEYKFNLILWISFHVSDEVKVIDASHDIILELIKLFIDFLFEFFKGHIEVYMV